MRHFRTLVNLAASLAMLSITQPAFSQLSPADIQSLKRQAIAEDWTFTVGENEATKRRIEELCGLVPPTDWKSSALTDPCTPHVALPSSFDWRTQGGCPPVRNQSSCGGCWAFGTVGPLECNILIKDGLTVDLSEQWLINCNSSDWSCAAGGWWAHDYHLYRMDSCGGTGAVLESSLPFQARDGACTCPFPHPYAINSWAFIGSETAIADTNAIKQAILDYGPVGSAVYVSSAFQAYTSGVFNACSNSSVNHAVVLVGWDDSQQCWIMRNSWGASWGENGYMRIRYGCSNIGLAANYILYDGNDALRVTPTSDSVSRGDAGGPFAPDSFSYTVRNAGTTATDWSATATQSWLSISPVSGSLAAGASDGVVVTVNGDANSLPSGSYAGEVVFQNLHTLRCTTRTVTLAAGAVDYLTESFDAADNDLDNTAFAFTPNPGVPSYYQVCRQEAASFPTDPTGGTVLSLGDDSNALVTLSSGKTVQFFGTDYSSFYVGSNGYITFGQGDNSNSRALSSHFEMRRISGLRLDLDPAASGARISWRQLSDRVAVTFENVPEWRTTLANSFQIELFFSPAGLESGPYPVTLPPAGTVRITYLAMGSKQGVAGLSRGAGLPGGFLETDLSACRSCSSYGVSLISCSPASMMAVCTSGQAAATQTLHVTNSGSGTLNYSLFTTGSSWLHTDPASGSSTGEQDDITVTFDPAGLAPGIWSGTITVSDPNSWNSPKVVNATLRVNAAPTPTPVSTPTPTPGPTATPSASPTPAPTATPSPTLPPHPTATPGSGPSPTPAATATPAPTPRPEHGPDLTGSFAARPVVQCARKSCRVRAKLTAENLGDEKAMPSKVYICISSDDAFDESDLPPLKVVELGAVRPGRLRTKQINVKAPSWAAGKHLIAVLDAEEALAEMDETNNAAISLPVD